jgi:RNA polymerase sigma-70 factor, ECF subfamily
MDTKTFRAEENPFTESELLAQAQSNPDYFAEIYELYFGRIYAYCARRVGTPEEAEDLTSLIFTRAWAAVAKYRGGSVAAWLFKIAHNCVVNHLRNRKSFGSSEHLALISADDNILAELEDQEKRAIVAKLIAKLPDDQRELLALSVAGQLSSKEIGVVLGKGEGAVRMALHRIIKGLRQAYHRIDEGKQ